MKHAAFNAYRFLSILGLAVILAGCVEEKEDNTSPTPAPIGDNSSSVSSTASSTPSVSSASNSPTSSAPSVSSASNVSSASSIPTPSSAASSSAAPVSNSGALLQWSHPSQRENGEFLELDEIGGYELRYRQNTQAEFVYIQIEGSRTTSYAIDSQQISYQFEISTYDENGLYSEFVPIAAR